jgi:uncharacterized protein YceK
MTNARAVVFALAASLLAGGCGTVANTLWLEPKDGGMRVYGGVKADLEVARDAAANNPPADHGALAIGMAVADLLLSAVADTVTLPVTLWSALHASPPDRPDTSRPRP